MGRLGVPSRPVSVHLRAWETPHFSDPLGWWQRGAQTTTRTQQLESFKRLKIMQVAKFTPSFGRCLTETRFLSQIKNWAIGGRAEDAGEGSCANVLRVGLAPTTPPFRYAIHPGILGSDHGWFACTVLPPRLQDRQRVWLDCGLRTPITPAGSGRRGAQRSGIKEEAEGRGTAAELSAPSA